jgi:hypothetical protein
MSRDQSAAAHAKFEAKNAGSCRILGHFGDSGEGSRRVLQRRNKTIAVASQHSEDLYDQGWMVPL